MSEIYHLSEYNWEKGTLISTGKKNYKISVQYPWGVPQIRYISKEKCAFPDEVVCVVWETWRGVNGRGGYRVEREKYPNDRICANQIARQHTDGHGRVTE
jgi:hypothetical protein